MPFVAFLQGYSQGHLNYVACTFIFIFFLNKYALYDKKITIYCCTFSVKLIIEYWKAFMNKEFNTNRLTPCGRISRIVLDVTVYISSYWNTNFHEESITTYEAFSSSFLKFQFGQISEVYVCVFCKSFRRSTRVNSVRKYFHNPRTISC